MLTSLSISAPTPKVFLHVLESPLVPDGSTPGTQVPLRAERPLTRRELRERETAEALRLESAAAAAQAASGAGGAGGAGPATTSAFDASAPHGGWHQQASPTGWAPAAASGQPVPVAPAAAYGQPVPVAPAAASGQPVPVAPAATPAVPAGAPQHPVVPVAAAQYPVAPAAAAEHPVVPQHPVAPQAERPGFDAIFGISDVAASPTAQPAVAHPAPTTSRRSAPTIPTIDTRTTEAEQADRSVGPSSASAVSSVGADRVASRRGSAGFDDLFAGLGDEQSGPSDEAGDGGSARRASSSRESRTDRKAAKAAKAAKGEKAAKGAKAAKVGKGGTSAKPARRSSAEPPMPVGPRRTGGTPVRAEPIDGDLAFLVSGAAAGAAATAAAAMRSGSDSAAVAGAASGFAAAISAAAGARPVDENRGAAASVVPAPLAFDLSALPAAAAPSSRRASRGVPADVTPASDLLGFAPSAAPRVDADAVAAPDRSASGASPASAGPVSRRDVARATAPSRRSAPQASGHRPARVAASGPASARKPRGGRRIASVVAMSFVAMLAVATTIPSLSLLSPADVQAMALASANGGDRGPAPPSART